MLDLALCQMYTRVFYLWKSINLDSVWVRDSRLCQIYVEEKVVVIHRGRCNNKVYYRLSHDVVT